MFKYLFNWVYLIISIIFLTMEDTTRKYQHKVIIRISNSEIDKLIETTHGTENTFELNKYLKYYYYSQQFELGY